MTPYWLLILTALCLGVIIALGAGARGRKVDLQQPPLRPPFRYWLADILILGAIAILMFGWIIAVIGLLVRLSHGVHQ